MDSAVATRIAWFAHWQVPPTIGLAQTADATMRMSLPIAVVVAASVDNGASQC
jgi:hypothetical protein